jgi:long-chain acyl-CoA synthetase
MTLELEKNLIQRVALGDMFRRRALTTPDKLALRDYKTGKEISHTFKELNQKMNCFASAAGNKGLKKGSRMAILGLNSAEFVMVGKKMEKILSKVEILYLIKADKQFLKENFGVINI